MLATESREEVDSVLDGIAAASQVPGCEVLPSFLSDDSCGDPADGKVLCTAEHVPTCGDRKLNRFFLWMCAYHLELTRKGHVGCAACGGTVTVLQVV